MLHCSRLRVQRARRLFVLGFQTVIMDRGSDRLFKDGRVFDEEFVPKEVLFREGQIVRLRQSLAPVFKGLKALHVLMLGPSGSGKTTVARHVLRDMAEHGIPTSYINCIETSSLYGVLDRIIVDHRILNADRVNTTYKMEQISKFLRGRPFVIVLDELDRALPKDRLQILYTLSNFGKLVIVGIASKPTFLQALDDHVRSRYSPVVIECQSYEMAALQAIVAQRAQLGVASSSVRPDLAKEIALLSAGDARAAIQALRRAAVNAGQRGGTSITSMDARSGWQNGAELKHAHALSLLNEHQRLLFRLLQWNREMTSKRLIEEYKLECSRHELKPMSQRTFWYYIQEMEAMGLIEGQPVAGRSNPRSYRVPGAGDPELASQ